MDITLIIITLLSLLIAATMCFVARRMIVEERRRSDARVAALASDIRGGNFEASAAELPLRNAPATVGRNEMFATRSSTSRVGVAAIAGAVVVTTAAILVIVFSGHGRTTPGPRGAAGSTAQSSHVSAAPLELVALSHEREADRITIHGIVRIPAGAAWTTHLTAVVLLFNAEGSFVASARADVNEATGEAGGEGTFVVTVPGAADVGRYRVSFRTDDHVVPHVDRREGAAL